MNVGHMLKAPARTTLVSLVMLQAPAFGATICTDTASLATSRSTFNREGARLEKEGKWIELEALTRYQTRLFPGDAMGWRGFAKSQVMLGRDVEAIEAYGKAIELQSYPKDWYRLGSVYRRTRQIEKATEAYKKAVHLDPRLADCWNDLGNILTDQSRLLQAIEAYKTAVNLNPENAEWWVNLSQGLAAIGRLEEAIEAAQAFKVALKLDSSDQQAWSELGKVYLRQERIPEAIAVYRQLLRVNPDLPQVWGNVGVMYDHLGDSRGVMECYEHLKNLNPTIAAEFERRCIQHERPPL